MSEKPERTLFEGRLNDDGKLSVTFPNPTAVKGPSLVGPAGITMREPETPDEASLVLDIALLDLWRRGREAGFRGGGIDEDALEKRRACMARVHELWERRAT